MLFLQGGKHVQASKLGECPHVLNILLVIGQSNGLLLKKQNEKYQHPLTN